MKTLLVFPPLANPTYAPLGPALLAGLARERLPGARVKVLDLNILAWELAARSIEGGEEALAFMRGAGGDFYDEERYAKAAANLRSVERWLGSLTGVARRSLDGEEGAGDFVGFFGTLAEHIVAEEADLVGFSFFSLAQLPWLLALAKEIKAKTGVAVVVGGASSTAVDFKELLIAAPFVDGMVLGEGDEAFLHLAGGGALREAPGLAFLDGGAVKRSKKPRPWMLENSPDPDFSDLDLGRYLNPSPVLPVLASRGCKWGKCRFCAHNSTYLGGYRMMNGEETAAMLDRLKARYGAAHFYFADLYLDAPEISALSEAILARGIEISFHALGRPTAEHTPELLGRAAFAGLRWISWGVESGSAKMLEVAGKGTRAEEVERVLEAGKRAGISNLAMMIFGLPTSTDGEMEETFAFLERIYPNIDAMTASAFALFTNAPFGMNPARWGLEPGERQEELRVDGKAVHSKRVEFEEVGEAGDKRPPRGEMEAASWSRRRRWLGEAPFLEGLPVEHYLLYVSRRYSERIASTGSSLPARQLG